jgi:hypothetical protein
VFASGTADGKRWALSVRNIAAAPGSHACLPAVMFNGRDGDVLFKLSRGAPSFGNPAFLASIPGFPGVGALFTQVAAGDTRLVGTSPSGRGITARPVRVRACGTSFNLAGYAFGESAHSIGEIATYNRFGLDEGQVLDNGTASGRAFGPTSPGVWANFDKSRADIAASLAGHPIGAGTVGGQIWHVRTSLGLFGQCYTTTTRGGGGRGQGLECVAVAAPPRAAALDWVSIPAARSQFTGYAGVVNPRTAKVVITLSDGTLPPARAVSVAGRRYIAFAVPPGSQVLSLSLYDSAGHMFASTTRLPPAK